MSSKIKAKLDKTSQEQIESVSLLNKRRQSFFVHWKLLDKTSERWRNFFSAFKVTQTARSFLLSKIRWKKKFFEFFFFVFSEKIFSLCDENEFEDFQRSAEENFLWAKRRVWRSNFENSSRNFSVRNWRKSFWNRKVFLLIVRQRLKSSPIDRRFRTRIRSIEEEILNEKIRFESNFHRRKVVFFLLPKFELIELNREVNSSSFSPIRSIFSKISVQWRNEEFFSTIKFNKLKIF